LTLKAAEHCSDVASSASKIIDLNSTPFSDDEQEHVVLMDILHRMSLALSAFPKVPMRSLPPQQGRI
jgi:hypothetical protein